MTFSVTYYLELHIPTYFYTINVTLSQQNNQFDLCW